MRRHTLTAIALGVALVGNSAVGAPFKNSRYEQKSPEEAKTNGRKAHLRESVWKYTTVVAPVLASGGAAVLVAVGAGPVAVVVVPMGLLVVAAVAEKRAADLHEQNTSTPAPTLYERER